MLTVADTAPDFTLPRDGGGTVTLSGFRPGKVVLYFYPKDDTPAGFHRPRGRLCRRGHHGDRRVQRQRQSP